jgi:8-oxo-dGTP pyrophosphatase MutT (NUDIX family)
VSDDARPPRPWRVASSRILYHDKWLHLRADECVTPAGRRISPYFVLEYPEWAHAVAITPDEQVVLIRQYRHGIGAVQNELPGGVIDPEDPDPLAAARRELREETGYDGDAHYLGAHAANAATQNNHAHTVLFVNARRVQEQSLDANEEIAVDLAPLASLRGALAGRRLGGSMFLASLLLAIAAYDEMT